MNKNVSCGTLGSGSDSTHATQTANDANKTSAATTATAVGITIASYVITIVQLREAIAILLLSTRFCFRSGFSFSCNILRLQEHIN